MGDDTVGGTGATDAQIDAVAARRRGHRETMLRFESILLLTTHGLASTLAGRDEEAEKFEATEERYERQRLDDARRSETAPQLK